MVFRIGGENLVATAFVQLLDLRQDNNSNPYFNELGAYLTTYQIDEYARACQKYLDDNGEEIFYEIHPNILNFPFLLQKIERKNYLFTWPSLNFIAGRNSHIFFSATKFDGNDFIFLKKNNIDYIREQLKSLFPRDVVATYVMLNKVKININKNSF